MTEKHMPMQKNNGKQKLERAVPINRYTPAVDIYETEEELVLFAEMPGVDEQGLQVEIDRNLLTLEAEISGSEGDAKSAYYRQFKLSAGFEADAAEAGMKDGVLRLRLPKAEAAKPKKIAVKTLH